MEDGAFNAVLYCNRAAAYHAMSKYIDAIADCFTAAALDASYVRVLQRRADAYVAVGDHTNAAQVGILLVSIAQYCCYTGHCMLCGVSKGLLQNSPKEVLHAILHELHVVKPAFHLLPYTALC